MIDWDRVIELREEVGEDSFDEVIELFLEEVEEVISRIAANGGSDNLEEDMHFLKGSAMNLGFASFGKMCQQAESAARSGLGQAVKLGEIFTCYAASKEHFTREASRRLAA